MSRTIFMVHGSGAGAWTWENFIDYFEGEKYQCVALDLPYHNQFPVNMPDPRLARISLLDYAEYLEDAICEMVRIGQIDSPLILMGHSLGGLLTQMLGNRERLKQALNKRGLCIDAMVLLAPAPPLGIDLSGLTRDQTIEEFFKIWDKLTEAEKKDFSFYHEKSFNRIPEEKQRELYDRLGYESGRVAFEVGFACLDPRKASFVDPSCISCPVLVLVGNEDQRVPPAVVQKIAEMYQPHSEYHVFAEHAHWLLLEPKWQDVAQYINRWLNQRHD